MIKLKKSLKDIFNCSKMQIMFKNKTRLGNYFHSKDQIPKDLTSGVIHKYQYGLCNGYYYGQYVRHLNVRTGEHIRISSLTKKQVKPKNSSVANHLLFCNHSASYDNFSILWRESKKCLLEWQINHLWMWTLHRHHCTYSTGPSNKIFVRILFVFNSCYIIPIEWAFLLFSHV